MAYYFLSNASRFEPILINNFNKQDKLCDHLTNKCNKCPQGYYVTNLNNLQEFYNKELYLYEVLLDENNLVKHNDYFTRTKMLYIKNKYLLYSKATQKLLNFEVNRTYLVNYILYTKDVLQDKLNFMREYNVFIDYIALANIYVKNKSQLRLIFTNKIIKKNIVEECIETFGDYEQEYKNLREFMSYFLKNKI
jgi:hypothetical protein